MCNKILCAIALGLMAATPSLAQSSETGSDAPGFFAGGIAFAPDYTGSDDYRVLPFAAARFELAGIRFRTEGPGLAASLYNQGPLELGVFARWSGGRDDVDDEIVDMLEDVDSSIITGGFANLTLAQGVLTERDRFGVGVDLGIDALGEFSGAAWSVSADYGAALSRTVFFALSASVSGYSDDYADTLFSVDTADAAASGLPVFSAEGGVQDIGITAVLDVTISQNWSVTGLAGYSRLQGDFKDSPIVSLRGSDDQFFTGLALGRRF